MPTSAVEVPAVESEPATLPVQPASSQVQPAVLRQPLGMRAPPPNAAGALARRVNARRAGNVASIPPVPRPRPKASAVDGSGTVTRHHFERIGAHFGMLAGESAVGCAGNADENAAERGRRGR